MESKKLNLLIANIFKKHVLSDQHATISSSALIKAELVGAYGNGI